MLKSCSDIELDQKMSHVEFACTTTHSIAQLSYKKEATLNNIELTWFAHRRNYNGVMGIIFLNILKLSLTL